MACFVLSRLQYVMAPWKFSSEPCSCVLLKYRRNTMYVLDNSHSSGGGTALGEAQPLILLIFCLILTDLPRNHRHQFILLLYVLCCCDKSLQNILQVCIKTLSVVLFRRPRASLVVLSSNMRFASAYGHNRNVLSQLQYDQLFKSSVWGCNNHFQCTLSSQFSLTNDNKGLRCHPNFSKTSAYTLQGHTCSTRHSHTHTHWSIKLLTICISKGLLWPSSQQGQGTFILIYSKGRFSFNFLHIHKRASHPRSRFPFQL